MLRRSYLRGGCCGLHRRTNEVVLFAAAADFRLYSGIICGNARRERERIWGVLRRYIRLCVRINLRITGKARLGRIIPGIRVCDLSVERTRLFFIQRNAPWFIRPRGVKGDAMNRKRDSITRSGSDLLFRVLRQSTIGVSGFHFRVRNGIECFS